MSKKAGFTLVELMVSVIIIVVLICMFSSCVKGCNKKTYSKPSDEELFRGNTNGW